MNRREFAGICGVAVAAPRALFGSAPSQDSQVRAITYPEFALALAETFRATWGRTSLAAPVRNTSGLLVESAAAIVNGDAEAAQEALRRFDSQSQDLLPEMRQLAINRGMRDLPETIQRGIALCRDDVVAYQETGDVVVSRISIDVVWCLLRAFGVFVPCLDQFWEEGLRCAILAIPMARLGPPGYVGAVTTCLLTEDVIDVAVDAVVECVPEFRARVAECLAG